MKKSLRYFLPVFLLAIAIGLTSFAREAQAATYYVSTSGSDNGDGSHGTPFQTLQHAADVAGPGDTVMVEDGTYLPFIINKSGASNAPVTFQSQDKWAAVIDGGGAGDGIIINSNISYINIKNFKIQNCHFEGILGHDGDSNIELHGNNVGDIASGGTGNNGAAAIDFNGNESYITMDGNVVHDIGGGADDHSEDHGLDFEYGTLSNIVLVNNIAYNNDYGWDIQLYSGSVTNLFVIGNTLASTNPANIGQLGLYMPMTNALVEDNIFYRPGGGAASYPAAGLSFTANNNLTTASTLGADASGTGNILNANPSSLFVNPGSYDFHLQASSPAVSAGLSWSGRTYDADGNTMVSPPDIGAYAVSAAGAAATPQTGTAAQITPPQLLTPSQGQTVSTSVTLQWSPAKDAAPVSYTVYVSQSPDFSSATPIQVAWARESTYAMGGGAAAFLMFGLAIPGWGRRRGRLVMLLLAGAMAAGLLVSCGGGGSGGSQPQASSSSAPASAGPSAATTASPAAGAVSYTVSGLSNNTKYYWKVVAQDNSGNTTQSQPGSFQTN